MIILLLHLSMCYVCHAYYVHQTHELFYMIKMHKPTWVQVLDKLKSVGHSNQAHGIDVIQGSVQAMSLIMVHHNIL